MLNNTISTQPIYGSQFYGSQFYGSQFYEPQYDYSEIYFDNVMTLMLIVVIVFQLIF
jgi:hypothetical protein